MSESENEYESADEDTEESSTAEKNTDSSVKQNTEIAEEIEEEAHLPENPMKPNEEPSMKSDDTKICESRIETSSPTPTNAQKSDSKPETSEAKQLPISTQPKRIPLRLEKKLQQKSRSMSIESEKAAEDPKPSEKTPPPLSSSSSWGFGTWGSSLLSTAAASVSTFTSQVSQGIGTVLETVESSLGAPPPEDLAAVLREKRNCEETVHKEASFEDDDVTPDEADGEGSLGSFTAASTLLTGVTSLTKVIENTGTKVIMGGLDTLELIGKKTMDILTEGDPGLRRKRSAFSGGMNLSQFLREAKEKLEAEQANMPVENQDAVHFSQFFDEYQGLVHLEALEMLSGQCHQKVQGALLVAVDSDEKEALEQVSRICEDIPSAEETPDDESQDFDAAVGVHIKELQIPFGLGKIKQVRSSVISYLESPEVPSETESTKARDPKDVYRQAISSLAEFTARCVEQFHKLGELILVQPESEFDILMCATHLTGLTSVLCIEINSIATKYCQYLNTCSGDSEDSDSINAFITNTYLEASNSTTYVQDAFQLLVPVLQSALLK